MKRQAVCKINDMKLSEIIRCPNDFSELSAESIGKNGYIHLCCQMCGAHYPLIGGIARLFDPESSSKADVKQRDFYETLYEKEIEAKADSDSAAEDSETAVNAIWRRVRDFYAASNSVKEVFDCFEEQFSFRGGEAVLEIGCGLGTPGTEVCLKNRHHIDYVGMDFALKPLLALNRKFVDQGADHFKLVHSNILDKCLVQESFDIIFGRGILHHFDRTHKPELAKRIYCLLKPGGKAFFLEPLNTNPIMISLRALSKHFRPNLMWEHPFWAKELKEFVSFFDSYEIHYFVALSLLSLAVAFHKGLFVITNSALRKIDNILANQVFWRRFYTKSVIVLYRH